MIIAQQEIYCFNNENENEETTQRDCALKGGVAGAIVGAEIAGLPGAIVGSIGGAIIGLVNCDGESEEVDKTCDL